MPVYLMWDDHDFAGDNSSETHRHTRGDVEIDRELPLQARKEYVPNPSTFQSFDDARFHLKAANILLAVPDSRSRKDPVAITTEVGSHGVGMCINLIDGSESKEDAKCWGEDQLNWLKSLFFQSRSTYKQLLVASQSFVDNLGMVAALPCDGNFMGYRDSQGIFYKDERNDLLRYLQHPFVNLRPYILTGDDHRPKITRRDFWHEPYLVAEEAPIIAEDITLALYEFKAGNGHHTTLMFDSALHPPYWWGSCADIYPFPPPPMGSANSDYADVGFCWYFDTTQPGNYDCIVQGVLFEDESGEVCGHLPRSAPFIFFEKSLDGSISQIE